MKKGAIEFSFTWLFAIIVGGLILFLAIYFASSLISQRGGQSGAQVSSDFMIALNPLESGFESNRKVEIVFPTEAKIYNKCQGTSGVFGSQKLAVSQKLFNSWTPASLEVSFPSKYLFSKYEIEDREVYVFSQSFEFPYKVTDLMVIFPKNKDYCFISAPEKIKENLELMNFGNILFDENCSSKANQEKVCFSNELNCEVYVDVDRNYVRKGEDIFYFTGENLMYGAIFSDYSIYECQVKRLMKKVGVLADLYREKISFISKQGCSSDLGPDLIQLSNMANSISDSKDLKGVYDFSVLVGAKNDNLDECRLW
jgi:hypothetical protein